MHKQTRNANTLIRIPQAYLVIDIYGCWMPNTAMGYSALFKTKRKDFHFSSFKHKPQGFDSFCRCNSISFKPFKLWRINIHRCKQQVIIRLYENPSLSFCFYAKTSYTILEIQILVLRPVLYPISATSVHKYFL